MRIAVAGALVVALGAGCAKKVDPVVRPQPPADLPGDDTTTIPRPPAPPEPVRDEAPVVNPTVTDDMGIGAKDLDALNRDSPLTPVFFALDSYDLSAEARTTLQASAKVLQQQPSWQVTIEGHCDERGTAEYNLSLGERRALAAKTYLVSLGIGADRLRTVSYGKEFPFDPGHDDAAWAKNRRAHFVITAK
ncbi:MAG: peptidoglycan-associated lipoprotein Pal [Vicinamibacterales bacterium]